MTLANALTASKDWVLSRVLPPAFSEVPFPDLRNCESLELAKSVQEVALRRRDDFRTSVLRVEYKAQVLVGYAAVLGLGLATHLGRYGALASNVGLIGLSWLLCGGLCAAWSLRVSATNGIESDEVLFFQPAFALGNTEDAERVYALTIAATAYMSARATEVSAYQKAFFVVRAEKMLALGTVFALASLARLSLFG